MNNVHIGSLIKQKVKESSMTNKEFADRINCERSSVYYIFKQKNINTEKLKKISEVLNYDFMSELYPEKNDKITHANPAVFIAVEINPDDLQQLVLQDYSILLIKKQI